MTKWLYTLSFKNRIWISFVLLISLGLILTGYASYYVASKVLRENTINNSQETLDKTVQMMDEKLRSIVVSTGNIIMSDAYKKMVQDLEHHLIPYYQHFSDLQPSFSQMLTMEPVIDSVLIVTSMGEFYPTTNQRKYAPKFEDTEIYSQIQDAKSSTWIPSHEDPFFTEGTEVLTFVLAPFTSLKEEHEVYILVNVKTDALKQMIIENSGKNKDNFLLIDGNGENVLSGNRQSIRELFGSESRLLEEIGAKERGDFEFQSNRGTYLVNYSRLSLMSDWVLILSKDRKVMFQQINGIKWTTMVITLIFIVLSFFISKWLTSALLAPLHRLQTLMSEVDFNHLDLRFTSKYKDEVSQVGMKFNQMVHRIRSLLRETEEMNEQKRKAEAKALQAQIDPHFLYNTLMTIYIKSQMGQHRDVESMIIDLANLFKLGLSSGKETTLLRNEIEHVKLYLELEKQCYTDLFEYQIEISDDVNMDEPILKLILQPLVENSILHGFRDEGRQGEITISVSQDLDKQFLILRVKDNGAGMDTDQVWHTIADPAADSEGYALKNVYERLVLHYNGAAEMFIHSEEGKGTEIELHIPPLIKEDAKYET